MLEWSRTATLGLPLFARHHALACSPGRRPSWIDGARRKASWPLSHKLPVGSRKTVRRNWSCLFRAIVFHPSAPILLADNDRHYREASVGASKLLGLPREKIIGRSLDDFAEPSFKPVISERWRAFLEEGEQEGTLQLVGPDGSPREVEYIAKGNVLPVRHLLVLRDKTQPRQTKTPQEQRSGLGAGLCAVPAGCGRTDCRLVCGSGTHLRL